MVSLPLRNSRICSQVSDSAFCIRICIRPRNALPLHIFRIILYWKILRYQWRRYHGTVRWFAESMPANALDYITIKGFKSIASVEKLELRPINVLIGANGSGKSNFIGVFAFLHEIREGRLQHYVTASGGAEKLLHFGSKTTREISFRLSFANQHCQY